MSSASGLDKSLMIIQYPAKIAVALLIALAAQLAKSTGGKGAAEGGLLVGREVVRDWAVRYAARLKALSSSIGDARTMMRLLGTFLSVPAHEQLLIHLYGTRHHPRPRLHPNSPLFLVAYGTDSALDQHPSNRVAHPVLSARKPLIPILKRRLSPLALSRAQLEYMELQVLGGICRTRCLAVGPAEEAIAGQGTGDQGKASKCREARCRARRQCVESGKDWMGRRSRGQCVRHCVRLFISCS